MDNLKTPPPARYTDPMLNQHWVSVSCLLGYVSPLLRTAAGLQEHWCLSALYHSTHTVTANWSAGIHSVSLQSQGGSHLEMKWTRCFIS